MDLDYSLEKIQQELEAADSDQSEGWKEKMMKKKMELINKENAELKEKLME